MTTVDDLVKVFKRGQQTVYADGYPVSLSDVDRAGIRAVVERLRDEFYNATYRTPWAAHRIETLHVGNVLFDQILGGEGEKVAGVARADELGIEVTGGDRREAVKQIPDQPEADIYDPSAPATTPATDPAPAVCVWRFNLERSVWRTHCGQYYGPFQAGDREPMKHCYHCSAPIKFTEAK